MRIARVPLPAPGKDKEGEVVYDETLWKWSNDKIDFFRDLPQVRKYVGNNVFNAHVTPYLQVEHQLDIQYLRDFEYRHDFRKALIIKGKMSKDKYAIVKDHNNKIYASDNSLTCNRICLLSPKMHVMGIIRRRTHLELSCKFTDRTFTDNLEFFQSALNNIRKPKDVSVTFHSISLRYQTMDVIVSNKEVTSDKLKFYNTKKRKMSYNDVLTDVKTSDIIQFVILVDSIRGPHIIHEICQIRVCGRLSTDFFQKNEFIDEKYHCLRKRIDYDKYKRDLIEVKDENDDDTGDSYSILDNLQDQINNGLRAKRDIYVQTPYMKLAYDVYNHTFNSYSVVLSFDDLKMDKDQINFFNQMKNIQESIRLPITQKRPKFYPLVNESDVYDPCIKILNIDDKRFINYISVYDEKGKTDKNRLKSLKKGTLVRCIFSFNGASAWYDENQGTCCVKIVVLPQQIQYISASNQEIGEICILDSDSEGW